MYNRRYKCSCMQNNYDENMVNTTCQNYGINADYREPSTNSDDIDSMNMNRYNYSCECGYKHEESAFPENPVLGQSYVPIQKMGKTFIPCVGLKMGTIFPELVSPYMPCQSIEENAFIKAMNTVGEGCNKC